MAKTYKKKQTRRRHRQRRQRASVRRLRKIQRGGEGVDDTIKAIVDGIEISVVKNALSQMIDVNDTVTLIIEKITGDTKITNQTPVSFSLDNNKIDFFIFTPPGVSQRFVYIYLNDELYGRIMLVINGHKYNDSYHESVANAIKVALIKYNITRMR